jgi:hypothetical protein
MGSRLREDERGVRIPLWQNETNCWESGAANFGKTKPLEEIA